jgi:predicted enzyme related to lactoylglutathione lyase
MDLRCRVGLTVRTVNRRTEDAVSRPPVWIDITARDAARSRAFYSELFGWEIHVDPAMDYGIVAAGDDRLRGGIGQAGDGSPHPPGVVVYVAVADVDEALQRAERLGGTRALDPWEIPGLGKMAVFEDPEGNRVGLWAS